MRRWSLRSWLSRLLYQEKRLQDPNLPWLYWAHGAMTSHGTAYSFDEAIRKMPAHPILEIGAWAGHSTNLLTYLCRKHHRHVPVFTVDPWTLGHGEGYAEFIHESFLRNVRFFSPTDLPFSFRLTSDQFFQHWHAGDVLTDLFGREVQLGGRLGFCFIDGDHAYGPARRDFLNCDRVLAAGGYLLLDDSADGSGWGVADLVPEVRQRYPVVHKNPHYLFRKPGREEGPGPAIPRV